MAVLIFATKKLYSFRFGVNETGVYTIDPDGQLIGHDPISVRCIFNDGEEAITEFGHEMVRMVKYFLDDKIHRKLIFNYRKMV